MKQTTSIQKKETTMKENQEPVHQSRMNESFFVRRPAAPGGQHAGSAVNAYNLQPVTVKREPAILNHTMFFMKKFLRRGGFFTILLMIVSLFFAENSFGQTTMVRFPLAGNFSPDIINVMGAPTATQQGLTSSSNNLCSGTSGHYYCEGSNDYVDITLNTTGYSGISISWQQRDYDAGGRWDLSGDADNDGIYEYSKTDNASVTNNCATITVNLPATFDNKATVHLRLTSAGVSNGNSQYIDNITLKGTLLSGYCAGNALSVVSSGGVTNSNSATGAPDGSYAQFDNTNGSNLVLDLTGGDLLKSGGTVKVTWKRSGGGGSTTSPLVKVEVSEDNSTWAAPVSGSPFTVANTTFTTLPITLNADTRYIRFTIDNTPNRNLQLDAVSYYAECHPPCVIPSAFNVTGTGSYCFGGAGVPVGLSNSESGVEYQLFSGANPVGSPVAGNGSPISFGNQPAGTYTVVATRISGGCTNNMIGNAVITSNPLPTATVTGQSDLKCYLSGDGSITINAASGTGPWSYSVDNGLNYTASATNPFVFGGLAAGQYKIRVKDANGCESKSVQ